MPVILNIIERAAKIKIRKILDIEIGKGTTDFELGLKALLYSSADIKAIHHISKQ